VSATGHVRPAPKAADATGWTPHSVRGFLAGLAKKGISVEVLERGCEGQLLCLLHRRCRPAMNDCSVLPGPYCDPRLGRTGQQAEPTT
jgi:hypothetical protein